MWRLGRQYLPHRPGQNSIRLTSSEHSFVLTRTDLQQLSSSLTVSTALAAYAVSKVPYPVGAAKLESMPPRVAHS